MLSMAVLSSVYLSTAGPRASLYYVSGKVGNLKSKLNII